MPATEQIVELVSTKEIELFLPLMRDIDFGDAFLLSMLHWCGIGKHSRPLEYWQVFLLRAKSQIIDVSGRTDNRECTSHVCWIGWFATRPQFRRQGFGTAAIHELCRTARSAGSTELWVYTGSQGDIARIFYLDLGFEVLGPARDCAPGRTMHDSDIVTKFGNRGFLSKRRRKGTPAGSHLLDHLPGWMRRVVPWLPRSSQTGPRQDSVSVLSTSR